MVKKPLLFVINQGVYPDYTGGMEIFNYFIIKRLASECDLYYMASKKYDYQGASFIRSCSLRPTKYLTPLYFFFYMLFHPRIKHVVFSYTPAHSILWRLYSLAVKLLKLKSYIIIHHGEKISECEVKKYKDLFIKSQVVVAVSTAIKENYDSIASVNCIVIPPLVPFIAPNESSEFYRKKYRIPANSFVISMVGSLKPIKNPQTILEALMLFTTEELLEIKPHIVFAGGGPDESVLKSFVIGNKLSDYVSFLGVVPKNDVGEIMCLTDIYLISSDFEGTSVSLLEAMYNSKPIIISSAQGLQDMIDSKSRLCFTTKNSFELKECIISYFNNNTLKIQNGNNARLIYDDKYSYESMVEMYKTIFGLS